MNLGVANVKQVRHWLMTGQMDSTQLVKLKAQQSWVLSTVTLAYCKTVYQ